jgi:hypothetical protein
MTCQSGPCRHSTSACWSMHWKDNCTRYAYGPHFIFCMPYRTKCISSHTALAGVGIGRISAHTPASFTGLVHCNSCILQSEMHSVYHSPPEPRHVPERSRSKPGHVPAYQNLDMYQHAAYLNLAISGPRNYASSDDGSGKSFDDDRTASILHTQGR